jgi:hypothetical protein
MDRRFTARRVNFQAPLPLIVPMYSLPSVSDTFGTIPVKYRLGTECSPVRNKRPARIRNEHGERVSDGLISNYESLQGSREVSEFFKFEFPKGRIPTKTFRDACEVFRPQTRAEAIYNVSFTLASNICELLNLTEHQTPDVFDVELSETLGSELPVLIADLRYLAKQANVCLFCSGAVRSQRQYFKHARSAKAQLLPDFRDKASISRMFVPVYDGESWHPYAVTELGLAILVKTYVKVKVSRRKRKARLATIELQTLTERLADSPRKALTRNYCFC